MVRPYAGWPDRANADQERRADNGGEFVRITEAEAIPFTFWHDREPLSYCLTRIETDEATVGWGEVCDSFGCTYGSVIETAVADAVAPLLIGEELDSPERLIHKVRSWTRRRLGHQWVAAHALSGIELALWDAIGKIGDKPVSSLVGGDARPVPLYASSVFLEEGTPEWHLELLAPLLDAGVRAVKLRIGVEWEADLETLTAIRGELDPAIALMIDGNENFTVTTALDIAERLAQLGVRWFEEPVPQDSPRAITAVAAGSPVPIAYGEHMFGLASFAEACERGQAHVLQPDVATCGGMAEALRIADEVVEAGFEVVPHTASGPVALSANLHFAAASPRVQLLEYPYPLAECWATIAPSCPIGPSHIVDGALCPPPGPGLGVEIDEDALHTRPYQPPAPRAGPSARFMGDV
jgi:D-galactarolactone cycloisomerase